MFNEITDDIYQIIIDDLTKIKKASVFTFKGTEVIYVEYVDNTVKYFNISDDDVKIINSSSNYTFNQYIDLTPTQLNIYLHLNGTVNEKISILKFLKKMNMKY